MIFNSKNNRRATSVVCFVVAAATVGLASGCGSKTPSGLDGQVRASIQANGISPLPALDFADPAKVALGQALFFDKELSGNRDIACSTCHSAVHHTVDGLSLSIGTGGTGTGPERQVGTGAFFSRKALTLFNRGFPEVTTMFVDSRVSGDPVNGFTTPAGDQLPQGLDSVLAAQALFPILSRAEMRGQVGDKDVFGNDNELAAFADDDFAGAWKAIVKRVTGNPEYVNLLQAAYPALSIDRIGIQHLANAIAAFETKAFTFTNSPWDQYVAGDDQALTDQQKRGAVLFYGKANCAACHAGNLLYDQQNDNILIPNIGPGRPGSAPLDAGVGLITGDPADNFVFRSEPLRNVELTPPYMHDGAYATLEAVVRHYNNIRKDTLNYDTSQLDPRLLDQVHNDVSTIVLMAHTFHDDDLPFLNLGEDEIQDLVGFLKAFTDPAARDLTSVIPTSVPSGLSIDP